MNPKMLILLVAIIAISFFVYLLVTKKIMRKEKFDMKLHRPRKMTTVPMGTTWDRASMLTATAPSAENPRITIG